jgi:hypothetical protein
VGVFCHEAGIAQAADSLGAQGVVLTSPIPATATQPLSFTVKLNGDQPSATYVFARFSNNRPMQRSAEGYWVPWSGNAADLIDNKFTPRDDKVVFKIIDENISAAFLPVQFFVAYRVGTTLKFGSLMVVRP